MIKIFYYFFVIILILITFQIYNKHFRYSFEDEIKIAYINNYNICLGNYNIYNQNIVNLYFKYIDIINQSNIYQDNLYKKGKVSIKILHLGKNNEERLINFERILKYAKNKNVFVWISALTPDNSYLEYNFYTYFANYNNIGITIASSNKKCNELVDNILSLNGHIRLVKGLYTKKDKDWNKISRVFLENANRLINSNTYHTIATQDFSILKRLNLSKDNIEYSFYFSALPYINTKINQYNLKIKNKSLYISQGDFTFFTDKIKYFDIYRVIKRQINSLLYF